MVARLIIRQASKEDFLSTDPNRDYFVWWDSLKRSDIGALRRALDSARTEHDVQCFLQNNPAFLIQHFGGGHGRWVIPKQRLGAEFVTDFIIGECDSNGFHWQAVELESPKAAMFTKSGDPTKHLTHAIRQIQDWRAWLHKNQSYAARKRSESGLGLTDIMPSLPGLVLIGRRAGIDPDLNDRRRQMVTDSHIQIHTYDFLLSAAAGRVEALSKKSTRPLRTIKIAR